MPARHPRAALLAVLAAAPLALAPAAATAAPRALVLPQRTDVLRSVDAGSGTANGAWGVDDGYVDGTPADPVPVTTRAGEAPAAVAATSRYGKHFTYTLRRLTPGTRYTVRLHFLEDWFDGAGKRLQDVTVNGTPALTGFDIYAAAGGKGIPVHRDVAATADASGRIVLDFTGTADNASVAGIQVIGLTPYTRLGSYLQVQGVKVTPIAPTATALTWTALPGVAQYAVLRDGKVIGRTGEWAYVDSTAVAGRTYRYSVVAVDPDGTLGLRMRPITVRMPSATPRATGAFHVEGTRIIDPAGKEYVPMGANLGTHFTLDGGGPALGHSADAVAWGWNTVRIMVSPTWWDEQYLRDLVAEYRKAGIVVMLDAHRQWNPFDPNAATYAEQTRAFWEKIAPEYKDDSGVWFNLANEPGYISDDWFEFQDSLAATVRATGAKNILVVDPPGWGQDLGSYAPWFIGGKFSYSPTMAPTLAARYGNVVIGQHNYGAKYNTPALFSGYVDAVRRNGLPVIASEFGYADDGVSGAGSFELNKQGTQSVFAVAPAKKVGMLIWNGNVGDPMTLKQGRAAFYVGGNSANLTPMGKEFWALTH